MANTQTLTTRLVVDDEASNPTEQYAKILDGLDGETATVVLALKAANVQGQLDDLLTEIAQLDSSDPTIDVKLAHAAELKSELDGLTGKIQEINGTAVDVETAPATKGIKDLGHEADNSKSVLANMVGNSTQDLGQLGGVAGSSGVAIGQLAEYAADGNISLSGLAAVAGPMAILGIAIKGLTDHAKHLAEIKAFNAKQVSDYADALESGASAADALAESLTKAGKVEFNLDLLGGTKIDITGQLAKIGLSVEQFATLVTSSQEQIDKWAESMRAAGQTPEPILLAIEDQKKKMEEAGKQAEVFGKVFGQSQKDAKNSTVPLTTAIEDQRSAVDDLRDANDLLRGSLDFERASLNFQTAMQSAQKSVAEGTALSRADILDLKDNYLTVAQQIGLTPVRIQSDLQKLDQGDINGVFLSTQQALDAHSPAIIDVEARLRRDKLIAQLQNAGVVPSGSSSRSVSGAQTINVNLPRGSRSSDISRAMSAHTRRAGRRYGAPVVTRAR